MLKPMGNLLFAAYSDVAAYASHALNPFTYKYQLELLAKGNEVNFFITDHKTWID